MNKTRICSRCKTEKPIEEFSKHPTCKDGINSCCKKCCYDKTREWLSKNWSVVKEDRAQRSSKWANENKERIYSIQTESYKRAKKKRISIGILGNEISLPSYYKKTYRQNNQFKSFCRYVTTYCIKIGWIKRLPCEACGEENKTDAHHEDYRKPFKITWLCKKHHRELHSNNGFIPIRSPKCFP